MWVTLSADFLTYAGWLAVQKADFILGPVLVGLYWYRRRPQSRFGPMLIGFGFLGALYILQSSSNSWLFSIGLLAETAIGIATRVLILAFPTGRLDRPAKVILVISILVSPVPAVLNQLLSPQTGAGASISGCRVACPRNEFAITSNPELAAALLDTFRFGVIFASILTAGLLIWRFATGTPPQRRALAIGTPIALLFLTFQVTFQLLGAVDAPPSVFSEFVKWGIVAARAALWYGFLAALIAAELFAKRALAHLVQQALQRPSRDELEAMLRDQLGDPDLRLIFLRGQEGSLRAEPGRAVTLISHQGAPRVAIVHDPQLNDDPELLETAGAAVLMAAENAELEAGWTEALQELERSRTRLVRAADDERRKFERNLHDSVQQRLISTKIRLEREAEEGDLSESRRERLRTIARSVEDALAEVRQIAHGLYPPLLIASGLPTAIRRARDHAASSPQIEAVGVGRYPPEIESAVYYCCLEAMQNATKHGGRDVNVSVALAEENGQLTFRVVDDGPGFAVGEVRGLGLQNMEDRLGALGGRLTITSAPGHGTTVSGTVPVGPLSPKR
ncbi:MAG TPA: ATP-binding protein [Candidatus Limnocylindrales bacterium]|nr:ATP-binding protein [Candidatus Limnocylindrales bacterium]